MRVLVTGAGGFIGQGVVNRLLSQGRHEIVATDRVQPPRAVFDNVKWMVGDIAEPDVIEGLFERPYDAILHLATVPGGAAEQDGAHAKRINIDATHQLLEHTRNKSSPPRVVFASSIAVYGDMETSLIVDDTPLSPQLVYGAHKAMTEQWIATLSRRGEMHGLSLRLPGILARPPRPSGMKSAFMSELFHAAKAGRRFVSPVSQDSTLWLMSRESAVANVMHALELDFARASPPSFAVTLPSLRVTMSDLVAQVAACCGINADFARYERDSALEAGFGRWPAQNFSRATALGFRTDGDMTQLVMQAFSTIDELECV